MVLTTPPKIRMEPKKSTPRVEARGARVAPPLRRREDLCLARIIYYMRLLVSIRH